MYITITMWDLLVSTNVDRVHGCLHDEIKLNYSSDFKLRGLAGRQSLLTVNQNILQIT